MKPRIDDPRRLDVQAFAAHTASLYGDVSTSDLPRLADDLQADERAAGPAPVVAWRAQGERRAARSGAPQVWLHLQAQAMLPLVCQRCLEAVWVDVQAARSLRFVEGEDEAARLDAELPDDAPEDALALPPSLDLLALVEDEMLLALPLVPRHDICPVPLPMPADDAGATVEPENPFAVLGALKRNGRPN